MYSLVKGLFARLLKVPTEPPAAPAGSYKSVQVFRASPSYLTYKLLPFWIGVLFELAFAFAPLAAVGVAGSQSKHPVAAVAGVSALAAFLLFLTFVSYVAIRLDYDLRYYVVTDRSLRIREGAMLVKEMTLTYANVQNLKIEQGPLQRWLGIADVVIDTAGGGAALQQQAGGTGHRAVLAGVDDAEGLRDLIRGYLQQARGEAGLGDEARQTKERRAAAAGAGLGLEAVTALREVRDEARALRRALEEGA